MKVPGIARRKMCHFGTFNDQNWINLMYKADIVEIMLEHQNHLIWVIKSAKTYTFSFWPCQELSIESLPFDIFIFHKIPS